MKILCVELTNVCNMDCWFCPHGKMTRPQGYMSMDTVKIVIEKMVVLKQRTVFLQHIGESLLHPKFFEIVDLFTDNRIACNLITNGCIIEESMVEHLINSRLVSIEISMDFAGDHENAIIKTMIDDPRVHVNIKGADRQKITEFRDMWGKKAIIRRLYNSAGKLDFKPDTYLGDRCIFIDDDRCNILWDGRVIACCLDADGVTAMGHVSDVDKLHHPVDGHELCHECGGFIG